MNPLIAGAFHRTGAVEVWGRGTNRVIEACKKHGMPPPTFEERQGFLIVTFKTQLVSGGTEDAGHPGVQETPVKASEKTSEKILSILAVNPETTIGELATHTGVTTRSVERNIQGLLARGHLKRIGTDKGGHWVVVK